MRFLKVTWDPFEAEFPSIENKFLHHVIIVVRVAGIEHIQGQVGECY